MENGEAFPTLKTVAGFWLQTVVAIGLTVNAALALTWSPRSLWFWAALTSLLVVESIAGLAISGHAAVAAPGFWPSGATLIAVLVLIAAEASAGLLAVTVHQCAREAAAMSDGVFAVLLAAKMGAFLTAAFVVCGSELALKSREQAGQRTRAEHRHSSAELHGVIAALESCEPGDAAARLRLDRLLKRLRAIETLLAHAPGGVGSWEAGPDHALNDGGQVRESIADMVRAAGELRHSSTDTVLSQVERQQRRLTNHLDRLNLV
jgi:hypothetical protein